MVLSYEEIIKTEDEKLCKDAIVKIIKKTNIIKAFEKQMYNDMEYDTETGEIKFMNDSDEIFLIVNLKQGSICKGKYTTAACEFISGEELRIIECLINLYVG